MQYKEITKILLQDHRIDPSAEDDLAILYAIQLGDIEIVKKFLSDERVRDLTSGGKYHLFDNACYEGHLDIVKLFLKDLRVDPNAGIGGAIFGGRDQVLKFLLQDTRIRPISDKYIKSDFIENVCKEGYFDIDFESDIEKVCEEGYTEIVKLLLMYPNIFDPTYYIHDCFIKTCKYGHIDIIRLLIDQCCSQDLHDGLQKAKKYGKYEIIDLLEKTLYLIAKQ